MSADTPIAPRPNAPGKRVSIALAVAVHLLLAGFLIYGVRWQTKSADVVEVDLVAAAPTPPPPVAAPPAPTPEPPPPKAEPVPAPTPPPRPEIVVKEKVKPEPRPEPRPVPPRIDPMQEMLRRESDQLQQRKAADSAAQELAQVKAAQAAAARNKAMADYLGRIRGKIRGNIVVPPEVKGNPEAVFDVTQLPGGEIVTVRLKRSSGNAALDTAIERAILKSNPLPKADPAELFSRSLELRFKPLED